jgi:hypothetical protein
MVTVAVASKSRHAMLWRSLRACVFPLAIAFLLSRGKCGWKLFDAETRSLGLFESQRATIDAINEAAP